MCRGCNKKGVKLMNIPLKYDIGDKINNKKISNMWIIVEKHRVSIYYYDKDEHKIGEQLCEREVK